ncbi:Protein trichome birefringence [Euphorbia peplus]|nr:Protein trichome birefringence [Euphorbia peplus]
MAGGLVIPAGLILLLFTIILQVEAVEEYRKKECNLYQGRWVHDSSYPLYNASNCEFITNGFNCQANRRPDTTYLRYHWKPDSCQLPRFNGKRFLLRMRGKRIMFVGDSIGQNQLHSLVCMLKTAVPGVEYTYERTGDLSTFTFPKYNVTVMQSWNVFLVDMVDDKNGSTVLKLNSIRNGGKLWKGMDTLIFNTWHHWSDTGTKQPWNLIQEGRAFYKDMDRMVAYKKALVTWATWIKRNIDPTQTRVFLQGVSPDHGNITSGNSSGKTCDGEIVPELNNLNYPRRYHPAEIVAEEVIKTLEVPVHLLNITSLSQARKDGHPSAYLHNIQHQHPDCTHWCLPGVPDTWNQLLYASLIDNL